MPTPARTSLSEIVSAGRDLVETQGLDGLTMHAVAKAVGVRAPSLYKHVPSRGDLIRLIVEAVLGELGDRLETARTGDPEEDLPALARAMRDFALANPGSYRAVFSPLPEEWAPDRQDFANASRVVLETTEALVGKDQALDAARLVTAWAHGFLSMELSGAFHLDGDVDQAFEYGLSQLTRSLAHQPPPL